MPNPVSADTNSAPLLVLLRFGFVFRRSVLLKTTNRFWSFFVFSSLLFFAFLTSITRSACLIVSFVLLMPSCSTLLVVSLSPAVSTKQTLYPSIVVSTSMVSLVVPGASLTMARSCPQSWFKSVDFQRLVLL